MNIHQALSRIPTCDFLTNAHMGYMKKDSWGSKDWTRSCCRCRFTVSGRAVRTAVWYLLLQKDSACFSEQPISNTRTISWLFLWMEWQQSRKWSPIELRRLFLCFSSVPSSLFEFEAVWENILIILSKTKRSERLFYKHCCHGNP